MHRDNKNIGIQVVDKKGMTKEIQTNYALLQCQVLQHNVVKAKEAISAKAVREKVTGCTTN